MTSQIDEIRRLLGKYYSGDSSSDDEQRLLAVMKDSPRLPDDIIIERDIIVGLDDCAPEMPSSLPVKIDAMIATIGSRQRHVRMRNVIAVAASAAVLIGIGYIIKRSAYNPYEVTDPKTAFNETRRALLLVSDGLKSTDAFINEANATFYGIDLSFYELEEAEETEPIENDQNIPEI